MNQGEASWYWIQATEDFFRVYIASFFKHRGVEGIRDTYANPRRTQGFA